MKKQKDKEQENLEREAEGEEKASSSAEADKQGGENGNTAEPEVEHDEALQDVITVLQESLAATQTEAEKNLDGWQRTQADFENYKKRVARDQNQLYEDTKGRITKRYLEIVDDLERALKNKPEEGNGAEWAEGIELIYRKLLGILESDGITAMEADGKQFDPKYHEAISQEDSPEHESGQIIEVMQQGFLIGERVLRPALVRVAS